MSRSCFKIVSCKCRKSFQPFYSFAAACHLFIAQVCNYGVMQEGLKKVERILAMLAKAALIALILVGLCTVVCFCPPVLTANQGSFILFPLPPGQEYSCDSVNNIKREEIYFKNPAGDKLHSWLFQSKQNDAPVILFCHGNAGNIGHRLMLAKWLMDAGASVFLFDYRAYGKSEGRKDLRGLVEDAQSAFDYLSKDRKIESGRIIIYGESIGGGPACEIASANEVGALILDSTFTSLLQIAKRKVAFFRIYPDFLQPIPAFNNIATLRRKHAPLLIVHGQKDEVIPYSEAEENFKAASESKALLSLPKSTHNWKAPDAEAYVAGVKNFLNSIRTVD